MLSEDEKIIDDILKEDSMEDKQFQWTGQFTRAVNGVMLSENFTFRMDNREELEAERKKVIENLVPSAKTFPEDEGDIAHTATEEQGEMCPVHKNAMTFKPAGVSKRTGKPYNGFWSCGIKNTDGTFCTYRPQKV